MPLSIVEGTHYDHEEYGPVKLTLVEDGHVYLEHLAATVAGVPIPRNYREPIEDFREAAEPRSMTIEAPVTTLTARTNAPGGN